MKAKSVRGLTVGAAQASPIFYDKRATVAKAGRFIAEAGRMGAASPSKIIYYY
ncbi:MAG: hypothetical protein ACE5JU_11920 [Candidatus Binatia bacterium]